MRTERPTHASREVKCNLKHARMTNDASEERSGLTVSEAQHNTKERDLPTASDASAKWLVSTCINLTEHDGRRKTKREQEGETLQALGSEDS